MPRFLRLLAATTFTFAAYVPAAHAQLAPAQTESLVLLGRVWGFAKYHHPAVTTGSIDWDAALRSVVPRVLIAPTTDAARDTIDAWLAAVGDPQECARCAAPAAPDAYMPPPIDWIRDEALLGRSLSERLRHMHRNRSTAWAKHHVQLVVGILNPQFTNESDYRADSLPPADLRLLGVYRLWNILEYWFPYRDLMEEDRVAILREFVPAALDARTTTDWHQTMMRLTARARDTHANLWSSLARFQPPIGTHQLPVSLRMAEGKFVVSGYVDSTHGPASGLRRGDVLLRLDGAPTDSLAHALAPYYGASNEAVRLNNIARSLTRGAGGPVQVEIERDGQRMIVTSPRVPTRELDLTRGVYHDRPGDAFQMLSDSVAYLKLSAVDAAQVPSYLTRAAGARVHVIDIRNYPRQFVVFTLGRHLVDRPQPFASFTVPDPINPGAFVWGNTVTLHPAMPRFAGRVVILVDEVSQSQAEYTAMAFRTAPGALVVGSTTSGADGNVSAIPLPGGLRAMISGIGVFYPDRRPTQQVGIVPDLVVTPTIRGIREGRDEVLEAAVRAALSPTGVGQDGTESDGNVTSKPRPRR